MRLLRTFVVDERAELLARGIRLITIGDEARLPRLVRAALTAVKQRTRRNRAMTLCLALSYGGARRSSPPHERSPRPRRVPACCPDAIDEARFAARSTRARCRRSIS